MTRMGLTDYLKEGAALGRNGDDSLAHFSREELEIFDHLQGGRSTNPLTGLPEYFSLKKVLKGVAKAAGALAGGYFGGPVGAAVGAGAVSKILGDSTSKALTTGLLAGLGSWGAQQTGLGDFVGGGFASGADLLGQTADAGVQTASAMADGVASNGGGMSLSAALPFLGLGAAALGGAGHQQDYSSSNPAAPDDTAAVEYQPLDRTQLAYQGDPYSYGVFSPEFQYFDQVNPDLQPVAMRVGGRIGYAEGGIGNSGKERDDAGPKGSGDSGRKSDQPPHAGTGGGQTSGLGNKGGFSGLHGESHVVDTLRGAGAFASPTGRISGIPNKHIQEGIQAFDKYRNRNGLWDALDFIGGPFINVEQPRWDKIGTYAGGDWHTGTSVPGAIGSIVGGLLGAPMIGGIAGQYAGDRLGIPDVLHGGYSDVPDWAKSTGTGAIHGPQGGTGNAGEMAAAGRSTRGPRGLPALPAPSADNAAGPDDGTGTNSGSDNPFTRTYVPLSDPYSYGQFGPEHQFFLDDLNMRGGGGVAGPGDGQSDEIPAMLSNGEYVMDAETVSALGDGSTDAGAAKLDAFRKNLRKHKRGAHPTKIPPKAKSITQYMRSAA